VQVLRTFGLSKEFGARTLFDGVSLAIESGEKLGLVGANGTGKTTLLRMLLGLEPPTGGSVTRADGLRIGYVPQHVTCPAGQSVQAHILDEFHTHATALRAAEEQLAHSADDALDKSLRAYQHARDAFERIDGDHYEARAAKMLSAFGLTAKLQQPVETLSGGEQNVLSLAKALLIRPDLLVLDEPANHLDYIGIAWLEEFLAGFNGAVLMVSHNRYLLDRVAEGILELEHGCVRRYAGNYSTYRALKLEEQMRQQRAFADYQKRLEKMQALVQRFADLARAHSNWGTRYRARQSQLRHLEAEAVDAPEAAAARAAIRFRADTTHANIVLRVQNYTKQYEDRVLLRAVNFEITSGERVALVGPNGCGKTSLLRDIITLGHWHHEHLRVGPSISVGYCAQQQEVLDPRRTIYEEMRAAGAASREQALGILARFLFRGDDVDKPVSALSGGERNRVQLARLMLLNPNFLILDEPTNHLDIDTREAVEDALDEFTGTLLVVSHDRYFLDKVATRILEVRDQTVASHSGSYTEFWLARAAREEEQTEPAPAPPPRPTPAVRPPARTAKHRAKQAHELEQTIAALEQRKLACEQAAAEAFAAGRHHDGTRAAQRLRALQDELDTNYHAWLAVQDPEE